MPDTCDPETTDCPPESSSQMPPAPAPDPSQNQSIDPSAGGSSQMPAAASPEGGEPTEHHDAVSETLETAHLAAEGAELGGHMLHAGPGFGAAATGAGVALGVGQTLYDAATGQGCPADDAMSIVPLMGPMSKIMMPSWCGPMPEQVNRDTGMTDRQEKAAGYMTPAQQ